MRTTTYDSLQGRAACPAGPRIVRVTVVITYSVQYLLSNHNAMVFSADPRSPPASLRLVYA